MLGDQALDKFIPLCLERNFLNILDIGAGKNQEHTNKMKGAGLKPKTADFFPRSDYRGDYNEIVFEDQFDAIWCSHVLEHQLNVNLFLTKIYNDVKEGGVVSVTVPPAKNLIVGGHVSLWNVGLLLYNMILAGFDCSEAMVKKYGYNISIVVVKKSFIRPNLSFDSPDTGKLRPYFPPAINPNRKRRFDGDVEEINWND